MSKHSKIYRRKKKYVVIVNCGKDGFKKWRFDDLSRFLPFLNRSYSNWLWYDLYNNLTKEHIKNIVNISFEGHIYICIVKLSGNDFKKWHTSDLLQFSSFLDTNYSTWRYFNVFDRTTGAQLASYTQKNRPLSINI